MPLTHSKRLTALILVDDMSSMLRTAGSDKVTILEDRDQNHDAGWDRELGGATDGHTVYSDVDPGLQRLNPGKLRLTAPIRASARRRGQ